MTGYVREALIGRSMHEIDVLEGAVKRDLAVERLHSGRTIPQMEACLTIASGDSKTVIVASAASDPSLSLCMARASP